MTDTHISVAVDTAEPDHFSTCSDGEEDNIFLFEKMWKTPDFEDHWNYSLSRALFIILTSILTITNR